jgi:hypothetical protein
MTDEHLRQSLRAMSSFGYGSAVVLFVSALFTLTFLVWPEKPSLRLVAGLLMLVSAVFSAALGYGLRTFRPWARTGAIVMSFAGLLAVPLGTILCGPFLYVLVKSKHLFTAQPAALIVPPEKIDRIAA